MAEMPPGLEPRLQLSTQVCWATPAERARDSGAQTQLVSARDPHSHRAPPSSRAPQACGSSPRIGRGDRLPSPPPHPYRVALGAAGFLDPPSSTPASANSQKNRWASAPACACPASPASTLPLAAPGWLPSDRSPYASLAAGSAQLGRGRSAWEAARLLNSSSPRLPRSPGGRPFNFLPRQLPFSTRAAASRDWICPGRNLGAQRPPSRRRRPTSALPGGGGRALLEPNLSAKQGWAWSGGKRRTQALTHTLIIHTRTGKSTSFRRKKCNHLD